MTASPRPHRPSLQAVPGRYQSPIQVRVRTVIPRSLQQEPVLSRLVSDYGLTFSVITANLQPQHDGMFDLQLTGTAEQLAAGLAYLESLEVAIASKPNPDGDSWSY